MFSFYEKGLYWSGLNKSCLVKCWFMNTVFINAYTYIRNEFATIIISRYNLLLYGMSYLQIPVMADLPVGDNLQDHILMGVTFNDRTNSAGAALPSLTTMLQYLIFRSGQWLF